MTDQEGMRASSHLIEMGDEIHTMVCRSSTFTRSRIDDHHHVEHMTWRDPHLDCGDVTYAKLMRQVDRAISPHKLLRRVARSCVRPSGREPVHTSDATGTGSGTTNLLHSLRRHDQSIRFHQSSTSKMFSVSPPSENRVTPFAPRLRAPRRRYAHTGSARATARRARFSRSAESCPTTTPRGATSRARKINRAVANIPKGDKSDLQMRFLASIRDLGFAPRYTDGMLRILQPVEPVVFNLTTGTAYTIRHFLTSRSRIPAKGETTRLSLTPRSCAHRGRRRR